MKIAIVERRPVRVFFLRYTGPFGEPLGKFWRGVVSPWLADHGLLDCPRYGVAVDNPMDTAPEKCRYDACVEVPEGLRLPDAQQTTIPGGRYAVTFFKGTGAEIGAAWGRFAGACSASHSVDLQRLPFEHYPRGAAFDSRTGVFACELCIPVSS
ncbi:MAG: GyrI-like domain-containing protein [Pseudomonadota bacterium]